MQLGRLDDAEKVLGSYIAEVPDDGLALSWLALVTGEQEKFDDATEHAKRAIQVAPDYAFAWYALGVVCFNRGRVGEAANAGRECIRLDPNDPDGFGLLAQVQVHKKEWPQALETVERGLVVDPEHDVCTNLKAVALRGLGRKDEAAEALRGQLARTPLDAATHNNQGWTCLDQGDYDGAREHFREALRLDPNFDPARAGIVETLKAKHWLYRPVLRYFLWMSKQTTKWQVAILVGGYVLFRIALSIARQDSPLAPVMWVVAGAYLVFALLSWFASPILNTLLLFHPFGRLALSGREKLQAAVVGSLLVGGVALGVAGAFQSVTQLTAGISMVILCLPVKILFELEQPRARTGMLAYTVAMLVLGGWWVSLAHSTSAEADELLPEIELARERANPVGQLERAPVFIGEGSGEDAEVVERELIVAPPDANDAESRDLLRRIEELKKDVGLRDTLGLIYAILGFWISQIVAGGARGLGDTAVAHIFKYGLMSSYSPSSLA